MLDLKQIQPLGVRLLVLLEPVGERKTDSGIILPDTHSELSRFGKVLAVGDKVTRFKKDDTVMIGYGVGVVVSHPDIESKAETLRMMNESEIMAKVGNYHK